MFQYSSSDLLNLIETALNYARQQGATAAEVDVSESIGQSVQVRLQEIEQIEHQQDKSFDITVYNGYRKGRASSADFSIDAIRTTVQAALNIAHYTEADHCAGLAEPHLMATECKDLDKYHEWLIDSQQSIELAKTCEQAALDYDKRIQNSEGANVQTQHMQFAYGNTHGFAQHQLASRHSLSCSVVAADKRGNMERDYWYDSNCRADYLENPNQIGEIAAQRTVRRLNAQNLKTNSYPIIFDSTISGSLIGHIVGALSGSSLYRENSFLLNSIGKQILPSHISLREEPHIPQSFSSTYFDAEGVATKPRFVIQDGIVQGYFLSSYSARKLGMQTTANAGGAHNLYLSHTVTTQKELLEQMGTGLLITELMGQGVNILTGDYSRGAFGFWVENGIISHPVSEIVIAGRLQDMFMNIQGIANDALQRSSNKIGSILINNMTVAGI